jgi:hypothetical protein
MKLAALLWEDTSGSAWFKPRLPRSDVSADCLPGARSLERDPRIVAGDELAG